MAVERIQRWYAELVANKALFKKTFGLFLIFVVAIVWVVGSFISKALVSDDSPDSNPSLSPFYLTYFGTTLFTIYLPFLWIQKRIQARSKPSGSSRSSTIPASPIHAGEVLEPPPQLTQRNAEQDAMAAAIWCSPLWFTGQYFFNVSLALTSVTSNTILSSSSPLFTLALSVMFLGERFTMKKLICVMCCILGTALVTVADRQEDGGQQSAWGDLAAVAAAAIYGSYTVMMRRKMPEDETCSVALFFGYIGLFTTIVLSPVVLILSLTGLDPFPEPAPSVVVLIITSGVLNYVLSDYLWARAVLLIGPTIATLGLSMQIPLATVSDFVFGNPKWVQHVTSSLLTVFGTFLILSGFFGINTGSEGSDEAPTVAEGGMSWWENVKRRISGPGYELVGHETSTV